MVWKRGNGVLVMPAKKETQAVADLWIKIPGLPDMSISGEAFNQDGSIRKECKAVKKALKQQEALAAQLAARRRRIAA